MDFKNFREVFYFLQLQFYVRGKQLNPHVLQFLYDLVQSSGEVHLAFETHKHHVPQKVMKRAPRWWNYGNTPVKPEQIGGLTLASDALPPLPADASSYLIFDFPTGHRRDQVVSIYKSLLVYDTVLDGHRIVDVANAFRRQTIKELIPFRKLTGYEFESCSTCRFPAEAEILGKLFSKTLFSSTEKNESVESVTFIEEREILRYQARAKVLIELTERGKFKEYPLYLK